MLALHSTRSALYSAHIEPLRRELVRLAENDFTRDDADDIVQDVLFRAYTSLHDYQGEWQPADVRGWLRGILRHAATDFRRKYRMRYETPYNDVLEPDAPSPAQRSDWWEFCRDEIRRLLRCERLPLTQMQCVHLRMRNFTEAAIGELVGLPQQRVSDLLANAEARLQARAARQSVLIVISPVMFRTMARATRYHRPQRRGAFVARQALRRLK